MTRVKQSAMKEIGSLDEIPAFANEREEAEYWASRGLGEEILERMEPLGDDVLPAARPRTRPIAVRFDEDTLRRLKALAKARHKGYQTLLKEFVVERLYEEEKRAGMVG